MLMFFSDMERKTLAITPPPSSSSSFFHLREGGGGFGSSKKAFHCFLLLSCLLLSSVNTLHNLAEFEHTCDVGLINGYNTALSPATKGVQSFKNGEGSGSDQNVCFLSALGSESQFDGNPIVFCDSALMIISNNNLSDGVVWLSLKPVHIIEFLHHQTFTGLFHIGEEKNRDESSVSVSVSSKGNEFMDHQCEWDSIKFLFFDATEVQKKKNSVVVSSGNGFMEQNQCYECWDSIKFLFFYRKEIAVFAVPMKATAPVLMLNLGKKPVFWVQRTTKKLSIIAVLVIAVAALLVLLFCFFVEEGDNCNHIAVGEVENKPITISPQMDSLLRSISKEDFNEVSEMNNGIKPITSVSSKEEASEESVNLTVKTSKRRRNKNKKKKGSGVSLLTDVSSSHSGNSSTPNSPMSPEPAATIQDTAIKTKTIQATMKPAKPVLSHSATFPVSEVNSMIIERSSLALNVRAPGSKPMKSRTEVKEEEESKKMAKEYDIWGDHHLTGLNLMDRFKEVREGKSSSGFGLGEVDDEESESFFVKGPQNYLADSRVRFVSFCNQWG